MVMVGRARKAAEGSVIWRLHVRRPLSSTRRAAPTVAALRKPTVTTEVAASPKCRCCFWEGQGCAGAFLLLLPENEGSECLQGHVSQAGD